MKPIANMTGEELAAFVQEHLRPKQIDMVLSGGACVSIYSSNRYVSMDLDLINHRSVSPRRSVLREAMREMGFREEGRHFRHPDSEFFVEFPGGPLAVGEEPVKRVDERRTATGILRLISPTDCVKDRLTWYYHDGDRQCLEQAILVAEENDIDLAEVERWSQVEGKKDEFERIRKIFPKIKASPQRGGG